MYLLTWFGTVVCFDPATEWPCHLPVLDKGSALALRLDNVVNDDGVFIFRPRESRPRALPRLAIQKPASWSVALLCIDTAGGSAKRWHYLSAVPGGAIEADRPYVSDWETFIALSEGNYGKLKVLLQDFRYKDAGSGYKNLAMTNGFAFNSSAGRIDIIQVLEQFESHKRDGQEILASETNIQLFGSS